MLKKQAVSIGITFMLLFTGVALAISPTLSATSDVIIYAFSIPPL
jgi:hypothetical protein